MALHRFLNNFTAGELTPLLDGRSDLQQYDSACRTLENMRVLPYGGARFRTGTAYVCTGKFADKKNRLFPFNFSTATRFVLEFGHEYVRFITNGVQVMNPTIHVITDVAQTQPATVYVTAHGFVEDQEILIDALVGPDVLNGNRYFVKNPTANTFEIFDRFGVPVDGFALAEYVSGGTAQAVYELATPYQHTDLFGLQWKQINDVMYLVHPNYAPRKLSRLGNVNWTLELVNFDGPALLSENKTDITLAIDVATVGTGRVLTASSDLFVPEQVGAFFQVSHEQNTLLTEIPLTVTATSTPIRVKGNWGIQSTGIWAGTIEVHRSFDGFATFQVIRVFTGASDRNVSAAGTELKDCQLRIGFTHTSHTGAPRAWLDSETATISGLVKITGVTDEQNAVVDVIVALASTEPTKVWREGAWSEYRGYPRAIGLYEQRLFLGGTVSSPTRFWGSVSDDFENFEDGSTDDAGLSFAAASAESNPIIWMEGMDVLQIGTAGGEIVARAGSQDEPLTPTNVAVRAQSAYGSDILQGLSVGEAVLFLQRQGRRIREMSYTLEKDRYISPDLTLLAEHITASGIDQMAFARQPDPLLMLVRDDGQLAVLTYNKEQNVTAWARWVTQGFFESATSVYGSPVDEIWFSVRRSVNGQTVRYIERMALEEIAPAEFGSSSGASSGLPAQILFLIDTTGSMGGIINAVKEQLVETANLYLGKFASATFALGQFKDETDPFLFTDFMDLAALQALVDGITVDGGGDEDENGYGAIVDAISRASWVSNTVRFTILFTDVDTHDRGATMEQALAALIANKSSFSYGIGLRYTYEPLRLATDGILIETTEDIAMQLLPSVFIPYEEFYLDCAKTGTTTTGLITGLDHLDGLSIRAVLNDAVMGDFTVTDGVIQLPLPAAGSYVVGLPYRGILQPMRLDTSLANGASQGRRRRITEVTFRFDRSQGCKFGRSLDALEEVPFRTVDNQADVGVPRFTGEKTVMWPRGYDGAANIFVVQDQPLPCTVLGLAVKHDFFGD